MNVFGKKTKSVRIKHYCLMFPNIGFSTVFLGALGFSLSTFQDLIHMDIHIIVVD